MYHNDESRLFYNTGNRTNSAKRCGAECLAEEDTESYPETSLLKRFRYLKKKSTLPPTTLQKVTKVQPRQKLNANVLHDSKIFNQNAQIEELESGMIHCKGLIAPSLAGMNGLICVGSTLFSAKLATLVLFEYTVMEGARNNETNIGRNIEEKLSSWKESFTDSKLAHHSLKDLRWVTLGRHHNWLETVPGDEKSAGEIPELFSKIGQELAKLLCFETENFKTEASIVNFYPASKSSIGIHRDDADYQVAPIITISLGCPGIFIIGKGERDEDCHEVYLQHGDVCVLEGLDRGALHAVPRIVSEEEAKKMSIPFCSPLENDPVSAYLRQARINISLRQITP